MFVSTCIVITLQFVIPVTPTLLNFVCEIICSQLVSLPSRFERGVTRSSKGGGVSVGGSVGRAKRRPEGRAHDVRRSAEGRGRNLEEMQFSNLQDHRLQL